MSKNGLIGKIFVINHVKSSNVATMKPYPVIGCTTIKEANRVNGILNNQNPNSKFEVSTISCFETVRPITLGKLIADQDF